DPDILLLIENEQFLRDLRGSPLVNAQVLRWYETFLSSVEWTVTCDEYLQLKTHCCFPFAVGFYGLGTRFNYIDPQNSHADAKRKTGQ
ncbi:11045_t:CDS:2, partial [Dentiscutata heterogama]